MFSASPHQVPFRIDIEHRDGVVRIRLAGELDLAFESIVERALQEAVSKAQTEIVVDLSGLDFMDSTGLSVLLRAHLRSVTDSAPPIRTIGARGPVKKLLEISGVQHTLHGNGEAPSIDEDRGWESHSSSRL